MNNYKFTFNSDATFDFVDRVEHRKAGDSTILKGETPVDALAKHGYSEIKLKDFTWIKMESMHVITDLTAGAMNDPAIFRELDDAGKHFQSLVMKEGSFRERKADETWEQYREAWQDFYDGNDYPHDTLDWEIHWDTEIPVQ